MNGGCVTDTATRLEKAREVWRKVKVKLFILGVGLRARARVVQSDRRCDTSVWSRDTYVFEKKFREIQEYLGGVLRHISYNKAMGEGTERYVGEHYDYRLQIQKRGLRTWRRRFYSDKPDTSDTPRDTKTPELKEWFSASVRLTKRKKAACGACTGKRSAMSWSS